LLLVLTEAERAWAYAMALKDDAAMNQDDNKPTERLAVHMKKRLRKAVRVATALLELCKKYANERTIVEAEAYLATMRATQAQAENKWSDALAQFSRASAIYKQMLSVSQTVALSKHVREIDTLIEFCIHRLAGEYLQASVDRVLTACACDQSLARRMLRWQLRARPPQTSTMR
jgi:signal recognition particle subunit SRP68